jgi:molecular chaperone IbpA
MRSFDVSPLYRSTIGFDRLFSMLDQTPSPDGVAAYPPYNIERTGEHNYRITVAVAGFSEQELSIETGENTLAIRGSKEHKSEAENGTRPDFLYQGIAERAFERRFQLMDDVHVTGARLENGLLDVDLLQEIPEAKKRHQIPIAGVKVVEARKAA